MTKKKAQSAQVSEPLELNVREETNGGEDDTQVKGSKALTRAQIHDLERDLGIKRRFAVIDKQKTEVGEGLIFDDVMEEDPTGERARDMFSFEPVVVNLGEQADRIMFDGKIYFQGNTYKVRKYQISSFNETMAASLRHDAEVNGRSKGLKNVKRNYGMGRDGVAVAGAGAVK